MQSSSAASLKELAPPEKHAAIDAMLASYEKKDIDKKELNVQLTFVVGKEVLSSALKALVPDLAKQQPAEPPTARTTRDHAQPASSGRGLVTTEPTSFAEQQLAALMELGFHAEAAAPYCDGVSSIEEIVDSLTAELEGSELPSSPRGNGGSSDRGQKQRRWQFSNINHTGPRTIPPQTDLSHATPRCITTSHATLRCVIT